MKYLKKFNEHYDNEELRSAFEIPVLTGGVRFDDLVQNGNIITDIDSDKYGLTFVRLVSDIPFIKNFEATKLNDALSIYKKFEKVLSEDEKILATMVITIDVNDDDSYVLQMDCKVYGYLDDKETILYSDDYNHQLMNSINALRGVFRSTLLYKIKDWSLNVKRYIGQDFMPEYVEKMRFNLRHN